MSEKPNDTEPEAQDLKNSTDSVTDPEVPIAESSEPTSNTNIVEDILDNDKPPSQRQPRATSSTEDDSSDDSQFFQCNICFDPVRQPVVTLCGHLFWYVA
jgi:E3 ubiquitin-protein ligase RNF5